MSQLLLAFMMLKLDEATIARHRSVDGIRACERMSEKIQELSSAVLSTQKKQKLESIQSLQRRKVM